MVPTSPRLIFVTAPWLCLRGADLRSAQLMLICAGRSQGALLDDAFDSVSPAGRLGPRPDWLNAAQFHNAVVAEAEAGRWPSLRSFFVCHPLDDDEPLSWAGRGVSRGFTKAALAASDFAVAEGSRVPAVICSLQPPQTTTASWL